MGTLGWWAFGWAFAYGSQGEPANGSHVNASWAGNSPRRERKSADWALQFDQIQRWPAMWVVGACIVFVTAGVLHMFNRWSRPKCRVNCCGHQLGLKAKMRKNLLASKRRRQRRRKKRPKPKRSQVLVARSAFMTGGRRYPGRPSRSHMGLWCGKRQGGMGLCKLCRAEGNRPAPGVGIQDLVPWLRDALAHQLAGEDPGDLGPGIVAQPAVLRDGTPEPRTVQKTHRAKSQDKQEMNKSHRPQEAKGPLVIPVERLGHDISPPGLPGVREAPSLCCHGTAGEVNELQNKNASEDETAYMKGGTLAATRRSGCVQREGSSELLAGNLFVGDLGSRVDEKNPAAARGDPVQVLAGVDSLGSPGASDLCEGGEPALALEDEMAQRLGVDQGQGCDQAPEIASHGMETAGRSTGTAVIENIAPWDWVQTPSGWARWAHLCRGGGGQSELLTGLQELLAKVKLQDARDDKVKAKGKVTKGKNSNAASSTPSSAGANKNGKGQGSNISNDADLLKALEHIVKEARKDPSKLLESVQAVVQRAVAGYGQGRAARRTRAKLQSQGKEHEGGGQEPPPKAVAPDFCRPVTREAQAGSEWTQVEGRRRPGTTVQQWNIDPLVGGLLGLGVVKRRLADGMPLGGHLVVASDQTELDAISSLARSHELKEALSVICRFAPAGDAKTLQLPSVGPKGQKQVRSWPAVAVSAGGSQAPQRKAVLKATFAAPDRKLVMLRLQMPKVFCESAQWELLCKQPNDHARRALGPVHSFGMWQKIQSGDKDHRELVLECYAKVAEGDKAAVLSKSGAAGVFVAELTRDQPKSSVEWIPPGDVEGPAYLQLVQRKTQTGSGSLAFRRGGGAALGIRIDPSKAGDRVQTWRARKVPREWTEEDLRGAFEAASFSDFEVVAPGRGSLPWLVRGKLKGDEGLPALVIQTDHHCIDVERAVAKRRLENVKAERLLVEAKRMAPTRPAPGPSKPTVAPDTAVGNTGKGKATGKAAHEAAGNAEQEAGRQRSRSPTRVQPEWYDVHECGGAGSCLFNAVGAHYAVHRDGQNWKDAVKLAKARGATLRSEIASYIREKQSHFKPFWLPPPEPADETERVNLEQMEDGAPPATWDEYLRNLDRPGRWADDLTFRALTRRLNCRILLLVGDVKAPQQIIAYGKKIDFKDDRKQVVVPVLYKDRHYQLVAPKTGRTLPAEWLEQEVGGHTQQVPRGGGWLPSRSSSQASDSVCEEGAWLPSRASSSSAAPSLREAGDWMPARASSASSRSASAPSRAKPAEGSARRASANRAANAWLPSRASGSSKASTKGCKRKASSMCGTGANTAKTARSCTSTQRRDAGANSPEPDLTPASEAPGWFCKICNKFVYPTAKRNLARSKNSSV